MSVLRRRVPWSFPEELEPGQIIFYVERRFASNRSIIVLLWMSSRYTSMDESILKTLFFSFCWSTAQAAYRAVRCSTFVFNLRWNPLGLFQIFRRNDIAGDRRSLDSRKARRGILSLSFSLSRSASVCAFLFFTMRTKKENKSTNAMRKRKTIIVSFYVLSVPIVQDQEKKLRTK